MKTSKSVSTWALFTLLSLKLGATVTLAGDMFSGDTLTESWQGKHSPTGEECRLQHRELEYSYPELFVSIPTSTAEREREAFSGLAQVQGMSYSEFKDLLYGESETRWSGDKGLFNFEASATGSSKSGTRKITFTGVPDTDRGKTGPGRKVTLNIRVMGDQISLDVTHQKKGFFGWKTVYQGACTNLRKTQTTKPTACESDSSLGEQSQEPISSNQPIDHVPLIESSVIPKVCSSQPDRTVDRSAVSDSLTKRLTHLFNSNASKNSSVYNRSMAAL